MTTAPVSDIRGKDVLDHGQVLWPHVHESLREITDPDELLGLARGDRLFYQDLELDSGWVRVDAEMVARDAAAWHEDLLAYLIEEKLEDVQQALLRNDRFFELRPEMVEPYLIRWITQTSPDTPMRQGLSALDDWIEHKEGLLRDTRDELYFLATQGEVEMPVIDYCPRLKATRFLLGNTYQNHHEPIRPEQLEEMAHWSWAFDSGLMYRALESQMEPAFFRSICQEALQKLQGHQKDHAPQTSEPEPGEPRWKRPNGRQVRSLEGAGRLVFEDNMLADDELRQALLEGLDTRSLYYLLPATTDEQNRQIIERVRQQLRPSERVAWLREAGDDLGGFLSWTEMQELIEVPGSIPPGEYMPLLRFAQPTAEQLREGFRWLAHHGRPRHALEAALGHKKLAQQTFGAPETQLIRQLFQEAENPEIRRKAFRALQLVEAHPEPPRQR